MLTGEFGFEHPESFQERRNIEAFLDDPFNRPDIVLDRARKTAYFVKELLSEGNEQVISTEPEAPISAISEEKFAELFDPTAPTIAIDAESSFAAHELVALAAAKRRLNVIIATNLTDCGSIARLADGSERLMLSHGIVVDGNGEVFAGELPFEIPVDAFETANLRLLRQFANHNLPTLSNPELVAKSNCKGNVAELVMQAGIKSPQRFELEELWQHNLEAAYVIKPAFGSGGRGVRMFHSANQRPEAASYVDFLRAAHYRPIIEERINSWPLFAPQESQEAEPQRLDWNVRALVANGELIDMYIRADHFGKAINRAKGAQAIKLEDLAQYVDVYTANMLTEKLLHAATSLAVCVPAGIAGADLTISEQGEPYLFELNVGQTGGLQTTAAMQVGQAAKLQGANRLVDAWLRRFEGPPLSRSDAAVVSRQKLERTRGNLLAGLRCLDATERLAHLPQPTLRDLQTGSLSHYDIMNWGLAKWQAQYYLPPHEQPSAPELYQLMMQAAPLEFCTSLVHFASLKPDVAALLECVNALELSLPQEAAFWPKVRAMLFGESGDLKKVREAMHEMIAAGEEPAEALTIAAAVITYPLYQHYDVTIQSDLDPWGLLPVCKAYLSSGYDEAMALIDQHDAPEDAVTRQGLLLLGLGLGTAENDLKRARMLLKELGNDAEAPLEAALERIKTCPTMAATQMLIEGSAYLSQISQALAYFIERAPYFSDREQEQLAKELAGRFAGTYEEEDQAETFAAFLSAYLHSPENAWQLRPEYGSLRQVGTMLFKPERHDMPWQELEANQKLSETDREIFLEFIAAGESFPMQNKQHRESTP